MGVECFAQCLAWSKHLTAIRHSSCHHYHWEGRSSHQEGKLRISSPSFLVTSEGPRSPSEFLHPWKGSLTASPPLHLPTGQSSRALRALSRGAQGGHEIQKYISSIREQGPLLLKAWLSYIWKSFSSHPNTHKPLFILTALSFYSDDCRDINIHIKESIPLRMKKGKPFSLFLSFFFFQSTKELFSCAFQKHQRTWTSKRGKMWKCAQTKAPGENQLCVRLCKRSSMHRDSQVSFDYFYLHLFIFYF